MEMRVMVLDDHEPTREVLKMVLELFITSEIYLADHSITALAQLDTFKPDLILTDYTMEGLNGLEFVKLARSRQCKAYCAVVTGNSSSELAEAVLAAGANDILPKPIGIKNIEILIVKAHNFINIRKQTLKEIELGAIELALKETPNYAAAAKALGINTATLWRKRKALAD